MIVARDPSADGTFWYSVATTGVVCRPSCASRTANPKNVRLHETLAEALAAGFRPCRRCRPEQDGDERATLVARACRLIDESERGLSLADLATALRMSPASVHRLFMATLGLSPRRYAEAGRAAKVRAALPGGASVTRSFYGAGFNASSRFYEKAPAILGMPPSRYRDGGAGETLRFALGETSLGALLVASSERGVAAILLGDDPEPLIRDLQDRFPRARLVGADESYERHVAEVIGHVAALVEAPGPGLSLPLDIRGTAFQQRVWQALAAIPAGRTATYAEVARAIGLPKASRAVAGACAANPLAVAIPCHRVVRSDGTLSGYAWGIARKKALLEREAAATPSPPVRR